MKRFSLVFWVGVVAFCGDSVTELGNLQEVDLQHVKASIHGLHNLQSNHHTKDNLQPFPFDGARGARNETGFPFKFLTASKVDAQPALIIGDDSPDELLDLSGDHTIQGDIVIMAQGQLTMSSGTLLLNGNIILQDQGRLTFSGGTLAFQPAYRYQHGFSARGTSSLELDHMTVTSNGFNLNGGFAEESRFLVKETTFQAGLTTGLFQDAVAEVDLSNPLEWVLQDRGSLTLSNNDGPFIVWPIFPEGSQADITFPSGVNLDHFELSDEDPNVFGLGVSLNLDNLGKVWWGLMLRSGADVTVRDSTMRTTGLIVDQGSEVKLSGLVNGATYVDRDFDLAGSHYRLVNSTVETWNVYAWGATSLQMDNCLFGELGALSLTDSTLQNCQIDGTGGYLFVEAETKTTLLATALLSDAIARGSSSLVCAYSSLMNGDVIATDQAVMVLLNSLTERIPQAKKSALVIDLNLVPPENPVVDDLLELHGNAFVAKGPDFPISIDHWQLFYAQGDGSNQNWIPIGNPGTSSERQSVLGIWNTAECQPGAYTLRLNMVLEGGFSLDTSRFVFLADNRGESSSVLVPHIASSSSWENWLTADNLGNQEAEVSIFQYQNGVLVATLKDYLGANEQQTYPLDSGTTALALANIGGVVFRETFIHTQEKGMAEFALTNEPGKVRSFLLPQYTGNTLSWMGLAVLNPNGTDANVVFSAVDGMGVSLGTSDQVVAGSQRMAAQVGGLFPGVDGSKIVRVRAESDQPISGMTLSGWNNERLLFTPATGLPDGGTFILPHIANNWNTWTNRLILDNLGDADREVSLDLFAGGELVGTEIISVPAGHSITFNLNDKSDLNPEFGVVSIADGGVALRMSYQNLDMGGTAEFILDKRLSKELAFLFPGAFESQVNWMGLAICNPSNQEAHLTLTGWKDGVLVATRQQDLGANRRMVNVLSGLFDGISDTGLDKVTLVSDVPVAGLNISGKDQQRLLFATAYPMSAEP